jgi:hypothetical protein
LIQEGKRILEQELAMIFAVVVIAFIDLDNADFLVQFVRL